MRNADKSIKRVLSLLLCLIMLVSTVAFAVTVNAEEVDELAGTGADTYYFYGENSNGPDFNATSPTGTFSYDSAKGYYYFDVPKFSGDYCFVVSTKSGSAKNAVSSQATTTVANGGNYYLVYGNYHGYACFHLWNPNGDMVRVYFTNAGSGLSAVSQTASDPTQAPTQAATQKATQNVGPTPTTAPAPTQSGNIGTDKRYVYCENEAGWATVYAYMWNSESDKNAVWPGVKMTNIGGNIWRYEVPKNFAKIIFNIGSNQTQTGDMEYPGDGFIYNNKTGEWEIYDTSPLQVVSYTTDVESPQYNGVGITLSALAEGQGTVYYRFTATNGSSTVVIADYSTNNQAMWIPQMAGTYTLTYEFRDTAGNTNKRTKEYVIESGLTSVAPYIKTVSPGGGEIQNGKAVNINVAAGGGITGTNLLFYKFTVKNASGAIVNTPYYTLKSTYSFTPSTLGEYTLTVDVQGSDNKTAQRTYTFTSVGALTPTEAPATEPPVVIPTQAPTTPRTAHYGDADDDGEISILDATYIQRHIIGLALPTSINLENAEVDGDGALSILDATYIQRFNVGIISKFPVES